MPVCKRDPALDTNWEYTRMKLIPDMTVHFRCCETLRSHISRGEFHLPLLNSPGKFGPGAYFPGIFKGVSTITPDQDLANEIVVAVKPA